MNEQEIFMEKIIRHLKDKRAIDISNVVNAYEIASKLHATQFRKGGEPYITHPVQVAYILERLDFDTNVISAALLHDTVEDCGYTVAEIERVFNKSIAKIVDAVTAIEGNLGHLSEDEFPKFLEEIQTYQKLISIGKENLFAFYIKFADRLHNLRTIGIFEKYKQMAKVKETENWLIPIIKLLKANAFYSDIVNECFKIQNSDTINIYTKIYNKFFAYNAENILSLKDSLSSTLNKFLEKKKENVKLQKFSIKPCNEYECYKLIEKVMQVKSVKDIRQSYLIKFPVTKMFVIFDTNKEDYDLRNLLFHFINDENTKNLLHIISYDFDDISKVPYYIVCDNKRNKYQLYAFNVKSFLKFRNGTTHGIDLSYMDETDSSVAEKYIQVKTKKGDVIKMPENSTILDFAFKIHRDFGFSVKYAYLNGAPTKSPIYSRLSNGDQVNLVIEKDKNTGLCKNIAQIKWIMYAKTEAAQKALVRYFENISE